MVSLVKFKASNHPQQVGKRGATERDNLGTDPALFARLHERFDFTLDVAALPANAKCEKFYTPEEDGLERSWAGERVWCNPPYSNIYWWVWTAWTRFRSDFSLRPPELVVMLLPANRTEQRWWQGMVEPYRDGRLESQRCSFGVEFLSGRQRFVMPGKEAIGPNERPPFGCCLLIWRSRVTEEGRGA